jgi:hypothetical protein
MGASCSIAGDCDRVSQFLPEELVIEILLILPLPDLISCQRVNRSLNRIIDSSERIQHQIETAIAGVVDNADSTLCLSERREAFALRQVAWDTCNPQYSAETSTGSYDILPEFIQCGVYFKLKHSYFPSRVAYHSPSQHDLSLEPTWSALEPIQKTGVSFILALAACIEENDLVAVGIWYVVLWLYGMIALSISYWSRDQHPPSPAYSVEVDLLCYSLGGGGHPLANETTLVVKDVLRENSSSSEMMMEIYANFLAVLFLYNPTFMAPRDAELQIFNWKTGEKLAVCV